MVASSTQNEGMINQKNTKLLSTYANVASIISKRLCSFTDAYGKNAAGRTALARILYHSKFMAAQDLHLNQSCCTPISFKIAIIAFMIGRRS